jgi:hypothetical protein
VFVIRKPTKDYYVRQEANIDLFAVPHPKDVVVRHDRGLHRGFLHSRHYGYDKGKKVVIKHTPTDRTLKTKAAS